jgi:hypothetical protein
MKKGAEVEDKEEDEISPNFRPIARLAWLLPL